jgi:hypothetical protein
MPLSFEEVRRACNNEINKSEELLRLISQVKESKCFMYVNAKFVY